MDEEVNNINHHTAWPFEESLEKNTNNFRVKLNVGDKFICELDKQFVDKIVRGIIIQKLENIKQLINTGKEISNFTSKIEGNTLVYNCEIRIEPIIDITQYIKINVETNE